MKPTYYVCTNSGMFTHVLHPSIAKTAEVVERLSELAVKSRGATCVFLLVVTGPRLEFLHADRFLDGVADGTITEETALQRF